MFVAAVLFSVGVGVIVGDWLSPHKLEDCKRKVKMNELCESAKSKLTPEEIQALDL